MKGSGDRPTDRVHNTISGDASGTTVQAETIHGGVGHHVTVHRHAPAPRALNAVPGPPVGFTGRTEELRGITERLNPRGPRDAGNGNEPEAVVISAVSGMGGVGKTALALQAAHVGWDSGWFCAFLFVDLHGYTPDTPALSAAQALDALLRQIGVDAEEIPASLDERAAFYRSALHDLARADEEGRPVLVVADNAYDPGQVEPLSPGQAGAAGAGGHRLLVTSRERFTIAGRRSLSLDTLTIEESVAFLVGRLGAEDARSADLDGLTALAERCGCLPLALTISCAQLTRTDHLASGELARRLAEPSRFSDGRGGLAAVFDASLSHLAEDRRRLFALLGHHPGPGFSTSAAAHLFGEAEDRVVELLEDLAAAHLIIEVAQDRWGMHDLSVDHARSLPTDGDEALTRLLDFYMALAQRADRRLKATEDDTAVLTLLDVECENLLAVVRAAHTAGRVRATVTLSADLGSYLALRRRFDDAVATHTLARDSAERSGAPLLEAFACKKLGDVLLLAHRYTESVEALERSRDVHLRLKDDRSTAAVMLALGFAQVGAGRYEEAVETSTHARDLARRIKDPGIETTALQNMGRALGEAGRFEESMTALARAQDLHRERQTEGEDQVRTWSEIGRTYFEQGYGENAVRALTRARDLAVRSEGTELQASAGVHLGVALAEAGRLEEAVDAHLRACELRAEIGDVAGEAESRTYLGSCLRELERYEEADEALSWAMELHRDAENVQGQALTWWHRGRWYGDTGRFEEAVEAFTRARDLHRELGNVKEEVVTSARLGAALKDAGRFDEALATCVRSRVLWRDVTHDVGSHMMDPTIGEIVLAAGWFDEALEAVAEDGELSERFGGGDGAAVVWSAVGRLVIEAQQEAQQEADRIEEGRVEASHLDVARLDLAVIALEQALELYEGGEDREGVAESAYLLHQACELTEEFEEALTYATRSRDLYRESGRRACEAKAELGRGRVLWALGRLEESADALHRSQRLFHEVGSPHNEAKAWIVLASVLGQTGRYEDALGAFGRAHDLYARGGDQGRAEELRRRVEQISNVAKRAVMRIEDETDPVLIDLVERWARESLRKLCWYAVATFGSSMAGLWWLSTLVPNPHGWYLYVIASLAGLAIGVFLRPLVKDHLRHRWMVAHLRESRRRSERRAALREEGDEDVLDEDAWDRDGRDEETRGRD